MPRFVILEHDYPILHWDFMLEFGSILRTWRLNSNPREGSEVRAEAIGDHRRTYLDYEGPVSGGRGSVIRWDAGEFVVEEVNSKRVEVVLRGARCSGRVKLWQTLDGWLFRLESDTNTAS